MNAEKLLQIVTWEGHYLAWWQIAARAVLIYIGALIVVRLGKKRLFGQNAAMDCILGVMFGSVASRAINGSGTLLPTLGAGLLLVGMHALSAKLSFFSPAIGALVKGEPRVLVRHGEKLRGAMQESDISDHDLDEALRVEGESDWSKVAEARLERNGKVSIVPKKEPPKVVEVKVENGVQTVRIVVG